MYDALPEELVNDQAQKFYQAHSTVALEKLLLKYSGKPLETALSLQLDARRKMAEKLPDWSKNQKIVFPPKANLEQASSQATALYKASILSFNNSLDLTGGSGIDSWQIALQSKRHVFVDSNLSLVNIAQHNFRVLNLNHVEFQHTTAEDFLIQNKEMFDLIYVDPSRRAKGHSKTLLLEEYAPNVVQYYNLLLKFSRILLVKVSPLADLSYLIRLFDQHLKEIHIVAVKNDCKEILLLFDSFHHVSPEIFAVNLDQNAAEFKFSYSELKSTFTLADKIDKYLYEPNNAVFKSGAFNLLSNIFQIKKLDISTHLYTSDDLVTNFPGKIYKVIEVAAPYKLLNAYQGISISSRNFPESPEAIRKRLKWKDGSRYKLFAVQYSGSKFFIVTESV